MTKCICGRTKYKSKILHLKRGDYSLKVCNVCGVERELEPIEDENEKAD